LGTEIVEINPNLSFRFNDAQELVCQSPGVREAISLTEDSAGAQRVCLVTGEEGPTVSLHAAIKGVYGAQSSGANIVSFNLDAFCSFNKKQGSNAPVGKSAAFAYTLRLTLYLVKIQHSV
jgi:CRISPR-associated protein Csd1